ncbi:MAG TPA: acyl-CoA dehydrogenase family protein [Polyangiales bacterium]|nr:acyl-CoA dehydrogenase family protein [Polyangiales bacterium]
MAIQLSLTEDQAMLQKTANAFFAEHSPLTRLRKLRDSGDELGYNRELFQQMAELGWTAIPFEERDGGLGMGLAGAILISEAMGRTLAVEPYIPSILLAGQVLALAGTPAQREAWLAPAIAGEKVLAFAQQEKTSRYSATNVQTKAVPSKNGGYTLNGEKHGVLAGARADAYLVSARTSGDSKSVNGVSLFLVPANTPGLKVTRQRRIDSRNAAIVELKDVQVGADALVGEKDGAGKLIEATLERATVALCGEMLGAMTAAFDSTLAYLKERKQFNVLIGSFQALKHRAAKMFIEIELARSATMLAARALDDNDPEAHALVSVAKARCSDAYVLVANEAVQLFAGIGMTDEHDIGFFIKHARTCELTFGDAAYHRDRFATLNGY